MPSQEHEQVVAMLASRPVPEKPPTLAEQRAGFEGLVQAFPPPPDMKVESVTADSVPADWISMPSSSQQRVVLYLHGGGYVIGSRNTHRGLAARIADTAQARVLLIDYRLAPEHPFPAAVEDATKAYGWLLKSGVRADQIAIAGDSAGGGLTIATLMALQKQHLPTPACGVCMSPWIDLEGIGASAQPGGARDPLIKLEGLRNMGRQYAADDLRNPLASPLYGNFEHLPPLLIQVGTRELLLDDSIRLADRAKKAGVMVDLQVEEGLVHVWQLFANLPEAVDAVATIGKFIRLKAR